ncbi:hypothetical protein N657DRAFT_60989 [Parathielavia appendiculata]|uniref:Uncharacterized protein n=1 Tax=Parathielavia appendiculata TaxID=2587402 RepID=A0AAN6UAM4_9PEZI|nr:hypothetical protein N657DRAFT_60989 [Parathielavia appendiculata]
MLLTSFALCILFFSCCCLALKRISLAFFFLLSFKTQTNVVANRKRRRTRPSRTSPGAKKPGPSNPIRPSLASHGTLQIDWFVGGLPPFPSAGSRPTVASSSPRHWLHSGACRSPGCKLMRMTTHAAQRSSELAAYPVSCFLLHSVPCCTSIHCVESLAAEESRKRRVWSPPKKMGGQGWRKRGMGKSVSNFALFGAGEEALPHSR